MSNSSPPLDYTITLSDTITIDSSVWNNISTATMSTGYTYSNIPSGNVTVGSGATGSNYMTITSGGNVGIGTATGSSFNWTVQTEEFVNCFPAWSRVEDMCEQYPGLKIAFEKFKTVYTLVKDDYDSSKDKK